METEPPYSEPTLPAELEAELRCLIAKHEIGKATRRMEQATGLPHSHCNIWVKDRVPYSEWYPPPTKPCPYCGAILKTDLANQCLLCGMDWHDPERIVRHPVANS
jgi:hypothetical protein